MGKRTKSQLGTWGVSVKALSAAHGLVSLLLNTTEQHFTSWDIVDQADDLTSGPDLR